ncbi:MAG: DUF3352 domain-containing protein [Anaerolineae bacterium]|nr:DUF3352 domain-containing protein [Anaerolineae bacterium]
MERSAKFCHKCGHPVPQQVRTTSFLPATAVSPLSTRSRRPHPLVMLALVLVLLCGGVIAGLYFWLGLNQTNQVARIVPADTVALISVSPSVWQLPQLRNAENLQSAAVALAPMAALPGVIRLGNHVSAYLPLELEIDPVEDILPWVGREVSLAIMAEESQVKTGRPAGKTSPSSTRTTLVYDGPPILLAAATRDQEVSSAFINNVRSQWEQEGVQFADTLYRDVSIMEIVFPREIPLAIATFNNLVVIATDVTTLQQTIDRAQGEGGAVLSEAPAYQETLGSLKGNRLGYLYLDVPQLLEAIPAEARLWQLQSLERIGVAVSLARHGLRFDYALHYDENSLSPAQVTWLSQPANRHHLLQRAPHDAMLYLSGQNLALLWQTFETPEMRETLADLEAEAQLGIDSPTELLDQMVGEFAVAIVPATTSVNDDETPFPEVLGLVGVVDGKVMAHTLQPLLDSAGASYVQDRIDGVPVHLFTLNRNQEPVGFSFMENLLVAGSSRRILAQAIQEDSTSLLENELFETAVAPLPNKNHGYFYLDVTQSYQLLESLLGNVNDEEVRPFLTGIQAISAATAPMDDDYVQHGTLHVVTK